MNESIEKDSQEVSLKRHEYLEDKNGNVESYEHDYDAYAEDKPEHNIEAALKSNLEKRRREQQAEASVGDGTVEYAPRLEGEIYEIGLLYFCIYETNAVTFIRYVLFAKTADIFVHLLLFGTQMLWIQIIFSMFAGCYSLLHHRGASSYRFYTTMFLFMISQQAMFSMNFVLCLVKATDRNMPFYVAVLALVFLLWLMQNIAWDFQVLDNLELLVIGQQQETTITEPAANHKSLEDSIGKDEVPEEKQTKNKLRKRASQQQLSEPSEDI